MESTNPMSDDPRPGSPHIDAIHQVADGRGRLADLLQPLLGDVQSHLELTDHAEDEISMAMQRHPGHADRLWHTFSLLTPTLDRLAARPVFRAHCRELLDRVARGEDTRPATAAECCVALMETSLAVPLATRAVGLYLRLWEHAGLPELWSNKDVREHYEALHGRQIDDDELWLRTRLRQGWRSLPAAITHVRRCPHTRHGQS